MLDTRQNSPMALPPDIGTPKFKPFDVLAHQMAVTAEAYKKAVDKAERRRLLALMRLILDEADSLHNFYSAEIEKTIR
jgi:hypothetical protein